MCAPADQTEQPSYTLSETKTTKRAEPEGFSSRGELETRLCWVGGKIVCNLYQSKNNGVLRTSWRELPRGQSTMCRASKSRSLREGDRLPAAASLAQWARMWGVMVRYNLMEVERLDQRPAHAMSAMETPASNRLWAPPLRMEWPE